jgi:serine phosphatase RsbU (regulator of sigma subunit)
MFVTMACLLIDGRAGTARIATAGHPPVIHIRIGEKGFNELRTPSLGLGMNAAAAFSDVEVSVKEGDIFLLYTDGVLEGVSPGGEQFGDAKMQSVLAEMAGSGSDFLPSAILDRLTEFTGAKAPRDDATVVAVRILTSLKQT